MVGERLEGFNESSMILDVDAAARWDDLEAVLLRRGATLGWAPPACGLNTIGDLAMVGAEGLRSATYGDLAANCIAVEAVLSNGKTVTSRVVPRSAAGPDWKHVLLGGRGCAGRIVRAVLRVYPVPETVIGAAWRFASVVGAVKSCAALMHRGAWPAVAVLVPDDEGEGMRLVATFQGHGALTRARVRIAERYCQEEGGTPMGEEPLNTFLERALLPNGALAPDGLLMSSSLRMDCSWRAMPRLVDVARESLHAAGSRVYPGQAMPRLADVARESLHAAGSRVYPGQAMPRLVDAARELPKGTYCVSHFRHDRAALLFRDDACSPDDLEAIQSSLEAAGGVSPWRSLKDGQASRLIFGESAGAG